MNLRVKTYNVENRREYVKTYLEILNVIIPEPLTDTEISLLVEFLSLPKKFKYNIFSSSAKKYVEEQFKSRGEKMSNNNISVKLGKMVKKGVIIKEDYNLYSLPNFISKDLDTEEIEIRLKIKTNETS